jgi:hypothetical protein
MEPSQANHVLVTLLTELLNGAPPGAAFILNGGDPGLLRSLDLLTASEASRIPESGGASIAAHVDHLTYGLSLMNRWSHGEEPFSSADWSASWQCLTVNDHEWADRRQRFATEARQWLDFLSRGGKPNLTPIEAGGVAGSIAHLAYHVGAMRQIEPKLKGPKAND